MPPKPANGSAKKGAKEGAKKDDDAPWQENVQFLLDTLQNRWFITCLNAREATH